MSAASARLGTAERTGATRRLAEHASALSVAALPAATLEQARTVLADTIGTIAGGCRRPNVEIALAALSASVAPRDGAAVDGRAVVVGHRLSAPPETAAFVNGIAAHVTELDDSHPPTRTHPAAVVVPAALAVAELASARAGDLLAGIVAGYDVTARLSRAMGVRAQFQRGFHAGPVCGAVGGAVAAARVLGLPAERIESTIALGASQASGLVTFEDDETGTLNSFHFGMAARNSVSAALLAAQGYPAAPDVLTGRHSMLSAFSGAVDADELVDALGQRYEIDETTLKRHACCGQIHSAIDAFLALRAEHGLSADQIERVDVELSHEAAAMVDGTPLPTHNIQYVLAVAAHAGHVAMEHFTAPWTSDVNIAAFGERVTVRGNDELQARFPRLKGARVQVTSDGRRYQSEYRAPRGGPDEPLSVEERRAKFVGLASLTFDAARVDDLWQRLVEIEPSETLGWLFQSLAG